MHLLYQAGRLGANTFAGLTRSPAAAPTMLVSLTGFLVLLGVGQAVRGRLRNA
jgi:hypothetical protein